MMVDLTYQMVLSTLQTAGLLVGIYYYIMTLNNTRQNQRITLTTTLLEPFMTVEGNQIIMDLIKMEWNDLDDYKRKYDHRVNSENYAKRAAVWKRLESLGLFYRRGLLDLETLRAGGDMIIVALWRKFKPVIEMYRKTDYNKSSNKNWEYLAESLYKEFPETVLADYVPPLKEIEEDT
jgi:hypothetical protein